MSSNPGLRQDALALAPDLVELRHRFHRRPELGLYLPETQAMLLESLEGLGLEIKLGDSLSSVTAVLRGTKPGPAVLLRADMDGLPVTEASGVDFSSTIDGAMHACGHDLHIAMLVGAARLLSAHRDQLVGDVVFMFQPGEEGWDGAGHMISEGVLDASGQRVSSAYGMHVISSGIPVGVFMTRPGTLMSASDGLCVRVKGSGGHGSAPHLGRDPIAVAAQMVGDLQTLVTRRFDIFDPVVITVGSFHAGSKRNVIPDDATFEATIRSFSEQSREQIRREVVTLCESIAAGYGLEVEATLIDEYPVTVNDPAHTQFVAETVSESFGDGHFQLMKSPQSGSEDFSRVLAAVPGCYMMLGANAEWDQTSAEFNHSPRAKFDDSVLHIGAQLHAEIAIAALIRDSEAQTPLLVSQNPR
jgi:amidohydrolase